MPKITQEPPPPRSTQRMAGRFSRRAKAMPKDGFVHTGAAEERVDPRTNEAMGFLVHNMGVFLEFLTLLTERGEYPNKIFAADQSRVNSIDQRLRPPPGKRLQFSSITILLESTLGVNCRISRRGMDGFSDKAFILNEPSQLIRLIEKLKVALGGSPEAIGKLETAVKQSPLSGKTAADYPTQKELEAREKKAATPGTSAAGAGASAKITKPEKTPKK